MKKITSLFLSLILSLSTLLSAPFVFGADSFEQQLLNAGFTSQYIAPLVELHEKYPNWEFKPLITGVNWSTAVANERTPHSQQLIQMTSSNSSKGYYCTCSSCYKNGNYVIQEGSSWVSASQSAVEYYMNPINFLSEKYIFQFESTAYDSSQTVSGVETILKGTWMYNSKIVYKDSNGTSHTYVNSKYPNGITYSQTIIEAAKVSGLSAYYIASKIVQEVGGSTNSAIGASGTNSTYPGIYNYYNIGAYTGGLDGLKWASQGASGYFTNCNANLRKSATTSSDKLVLLPEGTQVTYISTTGVQSDGYKWYKVSVKYNGTNYTGYLRSDLVDYSSSDKYSRPWKNPFDSIYHGAKYIAANFSDTQFTGYLQKFNVNPDSGDSMYSHEYMANVQAAVSESTNTYNAYVSANLLSAKKTFIIPVFKNMPNEIAKVTGLYTAGRGDDGARIRIAWDTVAGADSYNIYQKIDGQFKLIGNTTSSDYNVTGLTPGWEYYFKVAAVIDGKVGELSDELHTAAACATVETVSAESAGTNSILLKWEPIASHGYYIEWSTDPTFSTGVQGLNVVGSNASSQTINVSGNAKDYYVRIRAWRNWDLQPIYGNFSDPIRTPEGVPYKVFGIETVGRGDNGTRIRLSWNSQVGADGYNIYCYTNGAYKLVGSSDTNEYNVTGLNPGWEYSFKVSAVKDGKEGELSDEHNTAASPATIDNYSAKACGTNSIYVEWDSVACHGYYIEWSTDSTFTTGVNNTYIISSSATDCTLTVSSNPSSYYIRIRSLRNWNGGYLYGSFSQVIKVGESTRVEKVTGLYTAGRGDDGARIRLAWNMVDGASEYKIYQNISGNYEEVGTSSTNEYNVTGLHSGWEYYFKVSAVKNGKEGELSDEFHTVAACASPTGLTAEVISDNEISVKWDAGSAHGYYLEWSTDPTFATKQSANLVGVNNTSKTITVSGNASEYYVRVRLWRYWEDGYVYGNFSDAIKAAKVTGLYVAGRGDDGAKIRLAWNKVDGATEYKIYQKINGEFAEIGTTSSIDYNVNELHSGWEYYFKVSAIINGKEVGMSDELHTVAACASPTGISVKVVSNNELSVTWDVGSAHGYYIEWSTDPTFATKQSANLVGVNNTSKTITVSGDASKYYVRVRLWRYWEDGYVYGNFSDAIKA